jgi:hypothetical protein
MITKSAALPGIRDAAYRTGGEWLGPGKLSSLLVEIVTQNTMRINEMDSNLFMKKAVTVLRS